MVTYTFGIESRAHERSLLACPTLRWLGIHAADISRFGVPTSLKIDMTEEDRISVRKMLERESFTSKPDLQTGTRLLATAAADVLGPELVS